MKDSDFKRLPHKIEGLKIASCGTLVSPGYKPDMTVVDTNSHLKFIIESEQKTDRKAFLGDVLKAQKYSEECNAVPILVIVMKPQSNTTVKQIADHLQLYVNWLNKRFNGGMDLSGILVISDDEYQASIDADELLGSEAFLKRGMSVQLCAPT